MTNQVIEVLIDDEDILELVPDYLEGRRKELARLRDAVTQQDFNTLLMLGHQLKGSGGGYGLDRISEIGARLEHFARNHDLTAVTQEIIDLTDFLDRVRVAGC